MNYKKVSYTPWSRLRVSPSVYLFLLGRRVVGAGITDPLVYLFSSDNFSVWGDFTFSIELIKLYSNTHAHVS